MNGSDVVNPSNLPNLEAEPSRRPLPRPPPPHMHTAMFERDRQFSCYPSHLREPLRIMASPPASAGQGCAYGLRRCDPGGDPSSLAFQIVDVVVQDRRPATMHYTPEAAVGGSFLHTLPHGEASDEACTVCIFATEQSGASALIKVTGFRPHLTYEVPIAERARFTRAIEEALSCRVTCEPIQCKRLYGWVPAVDLPVGPPSDPPAVDPLSPVDPSAPRTFSCLRVFFSTVRAFRTAVRHGPVMGAAPWESKVDPVMMFFDHTSTVPCGWVSVTAARRCGTSGRSAHTAIELDCELRCIAPLDRMDVAPLLVASVDIECVSATGGFPDMDLPADRIGIIGTSFWRVGAPIESAVTVLLCVGDACDPVPGAHVEVYRTELEMLAAWRDLIAVRTDPDLVLGYNTFGFDYKYMATRARLCARFWYNSRLIARRSAVRVQELESSALGQNELTTLGWAGRVDIDLYNYIKAEHKLPQYKLDAVADHFLGERKVDLPYKELFACMLSGSPADLARACGYCAEDCRLPLKLCKRLEVVTSMVEMSRVTRTMLSQLVFRGQQIKVFNQLVWHAHRRGYVLNDPPVATESDAQGYEGATVIEPTPGFYASPVATLDFASLYPSIMLAHNLCYSTHVLDERHLGRVGVRYEEHHAARTHVFVASHPGVLPALLRDLLAERKRAKKAMATAATPELRALYNARQLALKISCNSVYGFTGAARRGMYPDLAIADSVTCRGRQMIQDTVQIVERFMPCSVIYGDTDSVMIRFHDTTVTKEAAFAMGERAAAHVSEQFREDVSLEMEKVYMPFLLIAKKRYAGLMYTPDRDGVLQLEKMDAKGVELVRRDNCAFAKRVYEQVLRPLLYECDPARAVANLRDNLEELVANAVDLQEFVLTKQLKKRESYVNQMQAHLLVAEKITARSKGALVPQCGDRLPFFIAEGTSDKISMRAEDPTWGRDHAVPPDRLYYLTNQIVRPVGTLFQAFQPKVRDAVTALFESAKMRLGVQRDGQTASIRDFLKPRALAAPVGEPTEEAMGEATGEPAGEAAGEAVGAQSVPAASRSLADSFGAEPLARRPSRPPPRRAPPPRKRPCATPSGRVLVPPVPRANPFTPG
jgi:DNA polymerase delta subunit 1